MQKRETGGRSIKGEEREKKFKAGALLSVSEKAWPGNPRDAGWGKPRGDVGYRIGSGKKRITGKPSKAPVNWPDIEDHGRTREKGDLGRGLNNPPSGGSGGGASSLQPEAVRKSLNW